jgi:hypothetical protein
VNSVTLTRCSALIACAAVIGCASDQPSRPPGPQRADVVSVGRPVAGRAVRVPAPGTVELRAAAPGPSARQVWFVAVLRPPPGRPRDACLAIGLEAQDRAEADTRCDISVPGTGAVSFVDVPGIPDRFGPSPTVITGVAPPGVQAMRLEGPGGRRALPLSEHRAFLAVYAPRARGKVSVVSQLGDRESVRSFGLPVSPRLYLSARHEHRRRGAVFSDEVGESITGRSYRQVVRQFGPPAAVRREQRLRCAYYEVVGSAGDGWRFCFARDGHMVSATGGSPPP